MGAGATQRQAETDGRSGRQAGSAAGGNATGSRTAAGSASARLRLERDAAERVLRRAVELDSEPTEADQRITVQALLDAADELGIDRAEVRRAVVEEELGLLDERPRRGDAFLGPERFVVARALDGTPEMIERRIDEWMRRSRSLRRSRRVAGVDGRSGWAEYTRRSDPLAATQRAARAARGHERLAHVHRVRVVVSPLDGQRCVVGMVVDASRGRRQAAAAGSAVAVSGSVASAALLAPDVFVLGLLGMAASVVAGAGVMVGRRAWTGDIADELEAVLDSVASGARPTTVIDDVADRLLRVKRT